MVMRPRGPARVCQRRGATFEALMDWRRCGTGRGDHSPPGYGSQTQRPAAKRIEVARISPIEGARPAGREQLSKRIASAAKRCNRLRYRARGACHRQRRAVGRHARRGGAALGRHAWLCPPHECEGVEHRSKVNLQGAHVRRLASFNYMVAPAGHPRPNR